MKTKTWSLLFSDFSGAWSIFPLTLLIVFLFVNFWQGLLFWSQLMAMQIAIEWIVRQVKTRLLKEESQQ